MSMKPTLKNDKFAGIVRENDAVLPIVTLTGTSIPTAGKQYNYTPTAGASLTFFTPEPGYDNAFKLNVQMPTPAVSFNLPATVTWRAGAPTFAAGTNTLLRFAWDGNNWVGEYEAPMGEYLKKVCDFNQSLSTPATCISIKNNNANLLDYSVNANGWGVITIGTTNNANSTTVLLNGKYVTVQPSINLRIGSPKIEIVYGSIGVDLYYQNVKVFDKSTKVLAAPGDIVATLSGGTTVSMSELLARIEALEA